MDIKDMMNGFGIDVYVVSDGGVEQYKPDENPLHKHSYKFDYKLEKHICTGCGKESEV